MADVLVLQHQDDAPAGLLAGVLSAAAPGSRVRTIRVADEVLPAEVDGVRAAVVLGSDASAVGGGTEPWIPQEIAWIRDVAEAGVPVLGICFGAQLLAAALGGEVQRLPTPQIGWVPVPSLDIRTLPSGPWLAWHEDAFTAPPGARVLAQDDVCVQAFAAGPHLGVQFHPEVTPAIVDGWIAGDGRELSARGYDPDDLGEQTRTHAPGAARDALRLFSRWLALSAPAR